MRNIEPHVSSMEQVTVIGSNTVQSTSNRVLCIFMADCGPLEPTEINSQSDFLATYTNGGAISRNAHRSFLHALKHSQSMPLMCIRVTENVMAKGITNNGDPVDTKDGKLLNYKISSAITLDPSTSDPAVAINHTKFIIAINNYVFAPDDVIDTQAYNDFLTNNNISNPIPVSIPAEYSTWSNTAEDLSYYLDSISKYMNNFMDGYIEFRVDGADASIKSLYYNNVFKVCSLMISSAVTVNTATVDLNTVNFILSPNYPSNTNLFKASINNVVAITRNGSNYYRFNLNIESKGEVNSYFLSTFPDDMNSSGMEMYLTSFNSMNTDITIVPVNNSVEVTDLEATQFGISLVTTSYADNTVIDLKLLNNALDKVEEIEGVRISILSDCGLCIPAYQKRLTILAETLKAIPALSAPDNKLIPYVTNYVSGVSIDSSYAWWGWPWNTDKSLADFPVDLSPVCYYIERIAANASGNQEFAPVFGKSTGICTGRNLHSNPTLAQRNVLQSYNINPIHYSKTDNIAYFVNDLTGLSQLNVLQEEQTRRLINKIRYEVDLLSESYLSYDWSLDTCDIIKSAIKNYFKNNILNMLRTIDGEPTINVTLNGLNKVKIEISVKPMGSVKYINIYYNILSMAA